MLNLLEQTLDNYTYSYNRDYLNSKKSKKNQKDYGLRDKCEEGVILHAWDWRFKDIKSNLKQIAKAGYTSVQVSPVQPNKDGNFDTNYDWWKLYQPIDFEIGNVLGTKEEFKDMCMEAHRYGIKIIVDVVTNHLANENGNGNHAKWDRNHNIPSYIRENDSFWQDESFGAFNNDDNDRTSMTQGAIGMPGLNTANKQLQEIIINFLNEMQDLGADGFRFDAAKHIGLPTDEISNDYWPTIINGIKNKKADAFVYGEILNECATDIQNYSKYMKVTDNVYGWNVLDAVINCNAGLAQYYMRQDIPKNLVTWVESHDTYAGDYGRKSISISDNNIILSWCILASRSDSIPMFYARPSEGLRGSIGSPSNTSWKNNLVVEINKFHNHFATKNEYIRILNSNTVFEIERGNCGVVIVNLDKNNANIHTQTTLDDGTYIDKVSRKKIKVQDGYLMTELNGRSVIIAYKEDIIEETPSLDIINTPIVNSNNSINQGFLYAFKDCNWNKDLFAYVYAKENSYTKVLTPWPGVKMNLNESTYSYELPEEWQNPNTQVIFTDGNNQIPFNYNPGAYYVSGTAMVFDGESIDYVTPSKLTAKLTPTEYLNIMKQNLHHELCS